MQCGLTTAQEQTQFRATHDIRRRDDEGKKASSSKIRFPPDMVFGISTRYLSLSLSLLSLASSSLILSLFLSDLQLLCLTFWSIATGNGGWRRGERQREDRDRKTTKRYKKHQLVILEHSRQTSSSDQKLQGVYETRASLMRRYSEPVDPPPLWKMKRWQKVYNKRHSTIKEIFIFLYFFLQDWSNVDDISNGRGQIYCLPSPRI